MPCASRHFESSPNSQDLPRLPASKSSSTGRLARSQIGCDARQRLTVFRGGTLESVALAEYRSQAGNQERALLIQKYLTPNPLAPPSIAGILGMSEPPV
jgi:hypothetical protein